MFELAEDFEPDGKGIATVASEREKYVYVGPSEGYVDWKFLNGLKRKDVAGIDIKQVWKDWKKDDNFESSMMIQDSGSEKLNLSVTSTTNRLHKIMID